MSFRTTLIWICVAAVLLGAIFLARQRGSRTAALLPKNVLEIKADSVKVVQVRPGNGLEIRAVRTNDAWHLVAPLSWPAQSLSITQLLQALEKLTPSTFITPEELRARPEAEKEYGFNEPKASIILEHAGGRLHLLAGAMTAPGDHFFMQVVGARGVFVVGADLLKLLPQSANDWRDRALVNLNQLEFDRVSVTNAGKAFSIQRQQPGPWKLVSPIKARADQARIHDTLEKIHSLRTQEFVSDDPDEDLEQFGLQSPRIELCFEQNNQPVAHLQFGRSVSNLVFARLAGWNTVVKVQDEFVSDLQRPIDDFRDPHLVSIMQPVESIEVAGDTPFRVAWTTAGGWQIAPSNWPGDADLVKEFIVALSALRIEKFVKDVVTTPDLPHFGLQAPARRYVVQLQSAEQQATNTIELQFGSEQENRVFARRADEDSVYAISATRVQALPSAPWQLRERRLWQFGLQEVKSVTFRNAGTDRQILREGDNDWALGQGSQGIINDLAIEETVRGVCLASVDRWAGFGPEQREPFGITEASPQLIIELKDGRRVAATFGSLTPSNGAYVEVLLEGQIWIGEFPWILCRDIMAHIAPPEKRS